jgi:hypothetical protein
MSSRLCFMSPPLSTMRRIEGPLTRPARAATLLAKVFWDFIAAPRIRRSPHGIGPLGDRTWRLGPRSHTCSASIRTNVCWTLDTAWRKLSKCGYTSRCGESRRPMPSLFGGSPSSDWGCCNVPQIGRSAPVLALAIRRRSECDASARHWRGLLAQGRDCSCDPTVWPVGRRTGTTLLGPGGAVPECHRTAGGSADHSGRRLWVVRR